MAGEAKRGPPGFQGLSSQRQAQFRQLWQGGAAAKLIEAEFNVSRRTVYNWGEKCGVAKGSKPPARQVQRMAGNQLRLLAELSQAEADRTALAASRSFHVLLLAAVHFFWASLSRDEQDYAKVLALDKFAPDWLEHAGAARLQRAKHDLTDAEDDVLAEWMIEDLTQGGEAAERVKAALDRAAGSALAQAAWREKAASLAQDLRAQAESLGRQRRRITAKYGSKGEA
jgi:hypothetical protein